MVQRGDPGTILPLMSLDDLLMRPPNTCFKLMYDRFNGIFSFKRYFLLEKDLREIIEQKKILSKVRLGRCRRPRGESSLL